MRIIVDTNLWISFLIGKKMATLKSLFTHPNVCVYVCEQLLYEFDDVSSRQKIRRYISENDVQDTYKLIDMYCRHVVVSKQAVSPVRDINDLFLLSFAETVSADYIVTGDKDLLTLRVHNQTGIVTYREFESIMELL